MYCRQAAGAALGSSIILWWGYNGIFLTSAIGRILAAILFFKLVRDLQSHIKAEEPDAALAAVETTQPAP